MLHHWLLITLSWIGTASLQYINTDGPAAESIIDMEPLISNPPYPIYFNQPQNSDNNGHAHYFHDQLQRKRRTADEERNWIPNLLDTEKTVYFENEEVPMPLVSNEENKTDEKAEMEKRNFSPWGGKRASIEQMWTWKRAAAMREPSMPKRVRFSPWGGKRSGQMIYKPSSDGLKVFFSTSMPEISRIHSNTLKGKRFDKTGFQFIPGKDTRHLTKVLDLSALLDEKTLKDALPFKAFLESLPKNYKPGHPYTEIHFKKDGKRKVKFSAWGGKRSPPIIGPIWTPAQQDQRDDILNTIILIRNSSDKDDRIIVNGY